MVQMDGSHHDWFEGRGPGCVLMGYIDDASSRVYARFYEYEGTLPAMDSFKRYIVKYGLPHTVYLDRHTTYKGSKQRTVEDELLNRQSLSQFGRALEVLGVHLIHAQSAPAKGRIERLFKTLQDRLIKEMRLEGITSIEAANVFLGRYLPVFNRRFSVEPLEKADVHRPLPGGLDLGTIFSMKTPRVLRNDFTVVHERKLYQVEDASRAKEVMVEERIDGTMRITDKARVLRYKEIIQRPEKIKAPRKIRKKIIPVWEHPWRNRVLNGYPVPSRKEVASAGAL
jgi:hypothetical protein